MSSTGMNPAAKPAHRPTLSTSPAIPDALGGDAKDHPLEAAISNVATQLMNDKEAVRRSLPDVAAEVLSLVQSSKSDAVAIEKAISKDPFTAAQLVSMSNSALFAPVNPILGV